MGIQQQIIDNSTMHLLRRNKSSAPSYSSEVKEQESAGKCYKHACADATDKFAKRAKVQTATKEQSKQVSTMFFDCAQKLADVNQDLANDLELASEWQNQLAEFAMGFQHSMDQFHKNTKAYIDKDYAEAKKVTDVYEKKRSEFVSAEAKLKKLGKNATNEQIKEAEREKDEAKAAMDAAEQKAKTHWQRTNDTASQMFRQSLATYWKDCATYFKQGHMMMDALQRDQTGVFDTKRLIGDDSTSNGRSASGSTSSMTTNTQSNTASSTASNPTASSASSAATPVAAKPAANDTKSVPKPRRAVGAAPAAATAAKSD